MSIFKKGLLDFWVCYGVLSGLIIALFYPLGIELVNEWRSDPEFSHGFLIPAVSVYIIWIERRRILHALSNRNSGKFNAGGLLLLLSGLIIFVFGTFIEHIFIQGIALLMVLSGIIDFLLGFTILRALWFPIGYLFFMLPLPYAANLFFAHRLKFFVAESSGLLLSLAGIPVLLEKNMLHLASISLEVVEACSGMQTMISFLAIGTIFAYFGFKSNILRGVIVVAAIPLSVLANILRVSAIGAISYYFNNDLAHGFHHYAWTLIVLIGVLGFGTVDMTLRHWTKRYSIRGLNVLMDGKNADGREDKVNRSMNRIWLRWMIVVMLLAIILFYVENAPFGKEMPSRKDLRLLPDRIGQWHQVFSGESNQMTALNDVGASVSEKFRNEEGEEVYLYIGFWGKFRKSINVFEGRTIAPGKNWVATNRTVRQMDLEGRSLKFNEISFNKGHENVLVSYWYVLGGEGVVNKETGRIKHAIDAMLNRRTNIALIKISSRYLSPSDLNRHQDLHSSFIRELTPILPEFLPYEL